MDPITQQTTLAAAGGKKDPVYVDDVFSTFLYEGNSSTQTITNDIDLTGEGGLVWIKSRENSTKNHNLYDTERGAGQRLSSNLTTEERDGSSNELMAFTSSGFTLGISSNVNSTSVGNYASWTFRKAPGFFDIVTWSGTNTNRDIAHNLGSVPGMVIVKRTDSSDSWYVYHRSHGATKYLELNLPGSGHTSSATWNNTTPTSSVFTVGSFLNATGATYVAYIFAHDDAQFGTDEDESIIKCGTWNGTSSAFDLDIGFEAQWIMYKKTTGSDNWFIIDNMRGLTAQGIDSRSLKANLSDAENGSGNYPAPYAKGFRPISGGENQSGHSYIYMAIRRPNKPPEAATEVFAIDTRAGTSPTPPTYKSGFPVDWVWERRSDTGNNWSARTRLIGEGKEFDLNTNGSEAANTNTRIEFDRNDGLGTDTSAVSTQYAWMFKRAPGFFDVVAYEGTGSNTTVNHNLEATPELMIIKRRNSADDWAVYSSAIGTATHLELNSSGAQKSSSDLFNNTNPTASVFSLSTNSQVNGSSYTYIAYLFATLPGISKVGTYSGTGNDINVDCGFTAGARFILIKQTNGTADWYVFDTVQGIVSGNDPYLKLNSSNTQVTGTDYVDPLNAGFTVTSSAPAWLNENGGNYIFLAIA